MKWMFYLLSGFSIAAIPLKRIPQTEISNGLIHSIIYTPDSKKGFYRGSRFDWSGNIASLEYSGHNYISQWFTKYNPEIHDAIMGPVEEFTPLDFMDTKTGGSFLKIGVGMLYKSDDKPYTFSRLYQIINPGKWTVKKKSDHVLFIHDLSDKLYSYHYEKTVQLTNGKPEMVLSHTLKNTGTRTIETSVYDHNFFVIDKHPIGPGLTIRFPFNITGEGNGIGELAEIEGNQIVFLRVLGNGETVSCPMLEGFSSSPNDYDIRIENRITGAGIRITCDQPLSKLAFWACSTTACPEPYIKIKVEPGKEITWTIKYEFYTLTK
jgi:hypothetical protein